MIILAVALFAVGVGLLMASSNFLAVYRSKLSRQQQGGAGAKGLVTVVAGGVLVLAGLVLLILRATGVA